MAQNDGGSAVRTSGVLYVPPPTAQFLALLIVYISRHKAPLVPKLSTTVLDALVWYRSYDQKANERSRLGPPSRQIIVKHRIRARFIK
jgi:hypothetical protein